MNVTPASCTAESPLGVQPLLKWLYIATELVIAVLAIVGNILVCLAVRCNKRLRTYTNYFLVSMAVADILVGLLAIPSAVLTDLGRPHHNLPLCRVLLSILLVLTQSSILSLLAVAAERYMAILLPFQYQRIMSPRSTRLALLATWALGGLSGSVPLMDWQRQPADSNVCVFSCVVDMRYMVYFNFFCCLLLPLVAMSIIYGRIFLTVRHQLRSIAVAGGGSSGGGASREDEERESKEGEAESGSETSSTSAPASRPKPRTRPHRELQKATSLFLLLFLFMVCWMPIHLINCIMLLCPQCNVPMWLVLVAILLSHANSALNPILYAYRMRSFRQTLVRMWRQVRMSVGPKPQ
ncbi:adenosine receptor A1-like [Parambassis ranga]|uniref:Adenosine receptor A1-like n=1 Tax=Parambassis ranga TaxID=210632 RepID=A0A6P7JJI3_9TELE|nr:adenosine receptor A1-like [Parambassis ranga]